MRANVGAALLTRVKFAARHHQLFLLLRIKEYDWFFLRSPSDGMRSPPARVFGRRCFAPAFQCPGCLFKSLVMWKMPWKKHVSMVTDEFFGKKNPFERERVFIISTSDPRLSPHSMHYYTFSMYLWLFLMLPACILDSASDLRSFPRPRTSSFCMSRFQPHVSPS